MKSALQYVCVCVCVCVYSSEAVVVSCVPVIMMNV